MMTPCPWGPNLPRGFSHKGFSSLPSLTRIRCVLSTQVVGE